MCVNKLTTADLYQNTFIPLEDSLLDDTVDSQVDLLRFYTSLLRNWGVDLVANTPPSYTSATIDALAQHVNTLTLTILENDRSNPESTSSVLSFYECTASLISHPGLQPVVRITTPPSELVYSLNFDNSLSALSRLCNILAIYKRAFEAAMSRPVPASADSQGASQQYPKDYVNQFNGFLMDICNCIWRSRAFNKSDTNALGCLMPAPIVQALTGYVSSLDTGLSLNSIFSLSYSPVLCSFSISLVRELEDKANAEEELEIRHAGPVTQKSLAALGREGGLELTWPQYRLGVLKYLEDKGVTGIGELMYNTMKQLLAQRENAATVN